MPDVATQRWILWRGEWRPRRLVARVSGGRVRYTFASSQKEQAHDPFRLGYSFAERRGFPHPGCLCLPRGRTELTHSAVKRALPLSRWFGDGCHALPGEEWDRGVRSAEVCQRQSSW